MNLSTSGAAALAADLQLSESEREQARLYLRQTHTGITGAIRGLSRAQWTFTPTPDCWSIGGIVEHVIFVFERILGPIREQLAQSPAPSPDRDYRLVDSIIIAQFPSRLAKFPAPEISHPGGSIASPAEALDLLKHTYGRLDEFLESPDLRLHELPSAPLKAVTKGAHESMDGYQWILVSAAHCERHTKQILEVRAHPNFPAA